jgi:hypothetical protein
MNNESKDLEERIKKIEEQAALTEKRLNILIDWVDKNIEKKPMVFCTDGPIMARGSRGFDKYDELELNGKFDDFKFEIDPLFSLDKKPVKNVTGKKSRRC